MNRSVSVIIRVVLIIMSLVSLFLAASWVPDAIEYLAVVSDSFALKVIAYVLSSLILVVSFVIYIFAFKFPAAVESDTIFTDYTAARVKSIAVLVLVDCVLLAAGVTVLFVFGEKLLAPLFLFFDVVGLAVSAVFFILSKYIRDAAALKEEVEHTL